MLNVKDIEKMAINKLGSEAALQAVMPEYRSDSELRAKPDDRYLSDMSMRVFMAGLSWRMVKKKWPQFEERFFHFNPKRCAFISPEEVEVYMRDASIIRHLPKIKSIPENAFFVDSIARQHGSFGNWLADWSGSDLVGLWAYMKKHGCRLGGMSGPMFLRITGKDTFLLTEDVVAALINFRIIDKKPTSKKALQEVQERFNIWQEESGRPYCEISRMLSLTV